MADEVVMTNDQALSLVAKMDVEQKTLRDLWVQFSPALRQVGALLEHYKAVVAELPELEKQKSALAAEVTKLSQGRANKLKEVQDELNKHKSALEADIATLEKELNDGRERVRAVNGAIKDAERQANLRLEDIEQKITNGNERLVAVRNEMAKIRDKVSA